MDTGPDLILHLLGLGGQVDPPVVEAGPVRDAQDLRLDVIDDGLATSYVWFDVGTDISDFSPVIHFSPINCPAFRTASRASFPQPSAPICSAKL